MHVHAHVRMHAHAHAHACTCMHMYAHVCKMHIYICAPRDHRQAVLDVRQSTDRHLLGRVGRCHHWHRTEPRTCICMSIWARPACAWVCMVHMHGHVARDRPPLHARGHWACAWACAWAWSHANGHLGCGSPLVVRVHGTNAPAVLC